MFASVISIHVYWGIISEKVAEVWRLSFLIFNELSRIPLMMGNAQRRVWKPRVLTCNKCGFSHDRSVEYRLEVSLMPWDSKGLMSLVWSS